MKPIRTLALLVFALTALCTSRASAADGEVNVILWFDTEDYLLPADDDATKRLCEMLTARNIRATFKLVGEKARTLQKRGRTDVIEALKKHDIGYHSNFHSVHPTPAEYLAECGLLDGMAEFARREGKGAEDVRRILGVDTLSCYGQPGSSWGSQTIAALKTIGVAPHGIGCYVDEGSHVGLNQKPFWYCGSLVVYKMGENRLRMDLHKPEAVEPEKEKITKAAERLRKEGGGLISIFYHPCEWVHTAFWDGVNFSKGANPPRELWKAPGQLSEAATNAAFDRFGQYIDHIRAIPNLRFVTASDLPELYPDRLKQKGASAADLDEIASRLASAQGVDIVTLEDRSYSPADQFEALTLALSEANKTGKLDFPVKPQGLLGPDSAPPAHPEGEKLKLTWAQFADGLRDAAAYIQAEHRVPPRVFIGATSVPTSDFLGGLASVYAQWRKTNALPTPDGVTLRPMDVLTEKSVAKDDPKLWGWVIHPEGFHAPKIMDVARLQAWTLKPAIRK